MDSSPLFPTKYQYTKTFVLSFLRLHAGLSRLTITTIAIIIVLVVSRITNMFYYHYDSYANCHDHCAYSTAMRVLERR